MTYRWEAEHIARALPVRREGRPEGSTWWGPSLWPSMQGESATPTEAAELLAEFGASGQRYRMVRSDEVVILYVEAGWRTWR